MLAVMGSGSVIPAVYATGSGTPLVLLHGVGTDHRAFRAQSIRLANRHRVLAWDMPGYGCSPALDPLDWPGLADALLRLLDVEGIEAAHILGHSIGGMVAQAFAARHPARVRSLILSATSPAFGRPDGDWQREFVRQRLAPLEAGKTMADLAEATIEGLVGPQTPKTAREFAQSCVAQIPVAAFAAAIRLIVTFDGRPDLAKIGCPTLLLAGEHDTNAPAAMMAKMAAKIAGARFAVLAGCGHLANIEESDAFDAAVLDFLGEVERHHA